MAISSLGVGSGLDLNSLVENLLNAERIPVESRLDKKEFQLQAELSAFGALSSSVSDLQNALAPLKELTEGRTASSSDGSILAVSVDETASVGGYSITANQLATNDSLASLGVADPTAYYGEGDLTFSFGTKSYTGASYTGFVENTEKTPATITIDSTNNTLEGIRDAINDADFGVSAVIVNDGGTNPYRLLLTSDDSGAENGINIAVSNASGSLGSLQYDIVGGVSPDMTQTVQAQDAQITVNGLNISSSSNTFSEAIPGLDLTVKDTSASPVSVNVDLDKGSAKNAISAFVEAFNSLIEGLDSLSKYNADTGEASVLTGDSLVRTLKSAMRNQIINQFGDGASAIQTFVDLGIKTGADGKLSVDSDTLDDALLNNFSDVIAFANAAGESIESLTDTYLGPGGTINARQDSLRDGIDNINDDRISLENRLVLLEASLVKKYSALDTLLAGLQSTSNFITTQLSTLDFSNNSKSSQ